MSDIECRVAKMEQRLDSLHTEYKADRDESRRRSDKIFDAIDQLRKDNDKHKGFFGGIVFTVSADFAVVIYFIK